MDKLLTNPNGKLLGNEDGKVYTTPAITDRTYKQKYQEVLWLGSDEIPEIPTQLPFGSSTDLITFLEGLKNLWSDIDSNLIEQYGYDRVVFLGYVNSIKKMVKCTIRYYESSGTYAINVHSSIYKENVKELISLNTNKRYKLKNDSSDVYRSYLSYYLTDIAYSKDEIRTMINNVTANNYLIRMGGKSVDFSEDGGNHEIEFEDIINTSVYMSMDIDGSMYFVVFETGGGISVYDEDNGVILSGGEFFDAISVGGFEPDNNLTILPQYAKDNSYIDIWYCIGYSPRYEI